MDEPILWCPEPPPPRSFPWLPIILSVGLHAGFMTILLCWPGRGQGEQVSDSTAGGSPHGRMEIRIAEMDDEHVAIQTQPAEVHIEPDTTVHTHPIAIGPEPDKSNLPIIAGNVTGSSAGEPTAGHAGVLTGVNSRPRVTGILTAPERARSIVYVIDRSLSMGLSGALEVAKRELLASLEQLPESARFQIVLYSTFAEVLSFQGRRDLAMATVGNLRDAALSLDRVDAGGGTNHLQALQCALALRPDAIILVTDADDLTPDQVGRVTLMNNGRSSIHTIELTTTQQRRHDGALQKLADANRGQHRVGIINTAQ